MPNRKMSASIALISMPFMTANRPSLGLGLLKSELSTYQIDSDVYYLNLLFEDIVGNEIVNKLDGSSRRDQVNEWVFVEALWGRNDIRDRRFMEEIVEGSDENDWIIRKEKAIQNCSDEIWRCRKQVDDFLNRCMEEIPWSNYQIVGFSSMFHQQTSSLSLAKKLKALYPDLYIVFGGVNCHGGMANILLKNFSFIDAVCVGEGDKVFPDFAKAVLDKNIPPSFPGMLQQNGIVPPPLRFLSSSDLDELPFPDYDEFFAQRLQYKNLVDEQLYLMIESSRGCWWGEKSHCTFCGLDDLTLHYRRKNPDRMLAEIIWLLEQYGEITRELFASDTIMPMEHFNSLLPRLRDLNLDVGIFYEIKANLKKHHVQLCKESGINRIQPGIESFSTKLLTMMKKGVTALQNIQLLKWCSQYGVHPEWNYLVGHPGERAEDFKDQPALIQALTHLPPPITGIRRIYINRFSPYHTQAGCFGITNLRPREAYRYIYPGVSAEDINELAYYFDGDFDGQEEIPTYTRAVQEEVDNWLDCHSTSALFSFEDGDQIVICDFRQNRRTPLTTLRGIDRQIYEACDQIRGRNYLQKIVSEQTGMENTDAVLDNILAPLLKNQLMLEENERYLSLAVPLGFEYFPSERIWPYFNSVLDKLEKTNGENK